MFSNLILTIKSLLDIFWVMAGVWCAYAAVGVILFKGDFGYCGPQHQKSLGVSYASCLAQGKQWHTYCMNFDSLDNALLFLFHISTFTDFGEHFQVMMNSGP